MPRKVTPKITDVIKKVKDGDRRTITLRTRIRENLDKAQDAYYQRPSKKIKQSAINRIRGLIPAGVLTEKEANAISFWIEVWGNTIDDNKVDIEQVWDPLQVTHHGTVGTDSTTRSLQEENRILRELLAAQ